MAFDILAIITICLGLSFVLSQIARRFRLPDIVGQIGAGIILGIPILEIYLTKDFRTSLAFLADIGIIFLLLLAGLEINISKLKKLSKDSVLISIFGAIIPFAVGFFATRLLGFSDQISIITGICMAITAEGTTLKILIDKNLLDTKVGTIILSAGILDDLYGIIFLGSFLMYLNNEKSVILTYPILILGFVGIVLLLFLILPKIIKSVEGEHSRITNLAMTLLIGLIIASISSQFGLGPILGAFIAGIIIHWVNKEKKEEHDIVLELKVLTFAFIIPFFFINIGLNMEFQGILSHWFLILVITIIAVVGKVLGSLIVSFITDISHRQALLIGWGMNSRGAIELVIANIALAAGLLTRDIYTAIVIMTIITTLFFPFVLDRMLKKYPHIMNEGEEPAKSKKKKANKI